MSNLRAIILSLLAIGLLVGLHLALDLSQTERQEMVRRKTLAPEADLARSIEISGPGRQTLRMEKADRWYLAVPFRAVVDRENVRRLGDELAFTPVIESVGESDALRLGRTLADFGLAQPRLTVRLDGFADRTVRLFFGDATPTKDGVYASVEGIPTVYVVPTNVYAAADIPLEFWRRRTIFALTPDEITSVDIRRGEGRFIRLLKNGDIWTLSEPRKGAASGAAVKKLLDSVLGCRTEKFVWPVGASNETSVASVSLLAGYGLDPEICDTVVVKTADGREHSVSLGRAADAGTVFALIQGGTAIATVPGEVKSSVAVDADVLADGRIFPFDKASVDRVSITDGETVYLLARGEGGAWRLDSPVAAPADEQVVSSLLEKLLVMRSSDLRSEGVQVSLTTNSTPVHIAKSALFADDSIEQLRSKTVLEIDPAMVKRVVVSRAGDEKPASVVYDPDRKAWNVEASASRAGVVDEPRLLSLLAALSPLKAVRVARLKVTAGELGEYGLETPRYTIAIDRLLEDSIRRNILIGDQIDGGAYATIGSSDAVFILSADSLKALTSDILSK